MDDVIKGMKFSLTADELRQLILDQAGLLELWLSTHRDAEPTLRAWRRDLHSMLLFGAAHLVHDVSYDLDRNEVLALFQTFED